MSNKNNNGDTSAENCTNGLDTVDRVIKELFEYGNHTNVDIQSFAEIHNNRAGRIVSFQN